MLGVRVRLNGLTGRLQASLARFQRLKATCSAGGR